MPHKQDPVSQVEIAEALGLSQSTVSLALRETGQVSKKTRELVARKAEELGYTPDPKMGALTSYRQPSSAKRNVPALAWITNFPTRHGWKKGHNLQHYSGSKRKASELGYQLREFWLQDQNVSREELQKDLSDQGIQGLLFAAQQSLDTNIVFDFSAFSSVSIGYSLKSPILHSVDSYAIGNIQLAVRSLQNLGYLKIGLAVSDRINTRANGAYYGGFLSVETIRDGDVVPPFMNEHFDDGMFGRWFDRWRPDAIIAWGDYLTKVDNWLKKRSIEVGKDVALAGLDLENEKGKYAGVHQQSELIGEVAVGTLVSYLNQFAYGVPEIAYQTMIDGLWVDGESAPTKSTRQGRVRR